MVKKEKNSNQPVLIMPKSELNTIKNNTASKSNSNRETGGVLIGKRISDNEVYCKEATGPGPQAEHHQTEFAPDIEHAQSILDDRRMSYDVFWIGTWHKHPGSMNRLSKGDINQMREFIKDTELLDEIFAIITTFENDTLTLNPFYMNESLKHNRVDLNIVDDPSEYDDEIKCSEDNDSSEVMDDNENEEQSNSGKTDNNSNNKGHNQYIRDIKDYFI